jgi:PAS domain S-box-containing protein
MAQQTPATILYVDDDDDTRRAFSWIFQGAGFAVKEAANGSEALRLAAEKPDVVVLDVDLPDINGFEVCRRIRADPATARVPVLHLSGVYVRSDEKAQALEGGADAYLVKPVEPREILASVHALLRTHQAGELARLVAREWQSTFDALSDGVCLLDTAGTMLRCNQSLAALLRRPRESLLGQPGPALLEAVFGPAVVQSLEELRRTRGRQTQELTCAAGTAHLAGRWFLLTADPVLDERGVLAGSVHLFTDITDRKKAEAERDQLLAERTHLAEHLRLLLESTAEGIYGTDLEGRCTFINPAGAEMLGQPPEALVGRKLHALAHQGPHGGPAVSEQDCPICRACRDGRRYQSDDVLLRRRDGTTFPAECASHPIVSGGALRGSVVNFLDATRRQRLEEQLRQSQKMEAIGRLAGGVAHDFNNLLTAVTSNASLLLAATPEKDPRRESLLAIETAAWRAAQLTRQLLGFARRSLLWLKPLELNRSVEEVVRLLRRTIDPRITVEMRCPPELWPVLGDSGQISQVLMNLCLNARDAMPAGGSLVLQAANVTLDDNEAEQHSGGRAGEFVRLSVSDTGHGIPPEVLPRIFEPFFTTKGVGQGTGLGLAVVFGIIQQHQGWVECHSEVNRGTRFSIYLPRRREEAAAEPAAAAAPGKEGAAPGRGSETILLVDDAPFLRAVGREMLQRHGYRVLVAEDGRHALEIYAGQQPIDLVILDLTMPRLSGPDTLQELRRLNPNVRVLFTSGYSSEHLGAAATEQVLGFIAKPYREEELVNQVRAALDRPAPPSP